MAMARLTTLVALMASIANAQNTGSVRGVVFLRPAVPLVGAQVVVRAGNSLFGATTDTSGAYEVRNVPVGPATVEIVCPVNRDRPHPVAARFDVHIQGSGNLDAGSRVAERECTPREETTHYGRWRGFYREGFEESTFWPCPDDSVAVMVRTYGDPFSRGAWVYDNQAWRKPGLGNLVPYPDSSIFRGHVHGFVEWSGTLRGPGFHGHLGVSTFELRVDSIFSMAPTGSCD
jgi:hypothetical protein